MEIALSINYAFGANYLYITKNDRHGNRYVFGSNGDGGSGIKIIITVPIEKIALNRGFGTIRPFV